MLVCQSVQVTSHKGQELYNNKNCQNCHLNSDQKTDLESQNTPSTLRHVDLKLSGVLEVKKKHESTLQKKNVSKEEKTGSITFHEILVI